MKNEPLTPDHEIKRPLGRLLFNIQSKLIFLLLTVLVPIIILEAVLHYNDFRTQRAYELRANLEIARAMAKMFDEFIRDVLRQELAIGIALTLPGPLSVEQVNQILDASNEEYQAVSAISWANPEGVVVASSERRRIGLDINDRPYFREIVAGREWVVSELLISRVTGQPIFTISRGILDEHGALRGVVLASISPENLDRVLAIERAAQGAITIIDRKGMVVFHSPPMEWTWENRNSLNVYPVIKNTLEGKEITTTVRSFVDKGKWVFALSPVLSIGWAAIASRPEHELTAPALEAVQRHALLFFLVALAAFLVALSISRTIAVPVKRLQECALAFGRGERGHRVEVSGSTELRDLAHAFNVMGEEVRVQEEQSERERQRAQRLAAEMESLAQERALHLAQMNTLIQASAEVLGETTTERLLQSVVDAARKVTGAKLGTAGHGYVEGFFQIGIASRSEDAPPCPPGEVFTVKRGGVFLDLIQKAKSIRLTERELHNHPAWWGLPEDHAQLRGLLGARLVDRHGQASGLIMVSDKEEGEFTEEDEALLTQLAALASLGLQHIEARGIAERRADEMETIFSALTNAVFVCDSDGTFVKANPAADAALGFDPVGMKREVLLEKLSIRNSDGKVLTSDKLPLSRALRGQTIVGERLMITNAEGSEFIIFSSASPLFAKGTVSGAVLVWHNVTEREKLFHQLDTERAKLKAIIESAPEAIVVADEQCSIIMTNPVAEKLYGRPVPYGEGVSSHDSFQLCYPDNTPYDPHDLPLTRSVVHGETHTNLDMAIIWPDGQRRDLLVNSAPIKDSQGRVSGAVGVFGDITEIKEAERERQRLLQQVNDYADELSKANEQLWHHANDLLAQREALHRAHEQLEIRVQERTADLAKANEALHNEVAERTQAEKLLQEKHELLETIFSSVHFLVAYMDTDFNFIRVNRAYAKVEGCEPEFFVGKNHFDLYPNPENEAIFRKVVETGEPYFVFEAPFEYARHPEWGITYWDWSLHPVKSLDGKVSGVVLDLVNVTERKKAVMALRESEMQLRHLSTQLLAAQEKERKYLAQELHDSIGQTLAAIKFGLDMALTHLREGASETAVQSLENITPMLQNGINEVRQIQMNLRPSMLDDLGILATIRWFCREFQKVFSTILIHTQIGIEESEVPDALKITLYRIIQEAFNNIAKHSKAGLVTLSLRGMEGKIHLAIKDNGVGFEVDRALHGDTYRKGLGLASMKERAELSGGAFAINSSMGEGTIIAASWPYRREIAA